MLEECMIKEVARVVLQPRHDLRVFCEEFPEIVVFVKILLVPNERGIPPQLVLEQRMVIEKPIELAQRMMHGGKLGRRHRTNS